MQKTILFICLLINSLLFCADSSNPITPYHERVARNTLQLQTSDSHILRQMGIERYTVMAQAIGRYMAGITVYHSYKLAAQDKQQLIDDLEITRRRIRTSPDLQQALFGQVQTLLSMHTKLLPELYVHKVAIDHVQKESMSHMTEYEIKQCTDMWQQIDEAFKITYLTELESWLYRSQEALKEEVSEHDCTIS